MKELAQYKKNIINISLIVMIINCIFLCIYSLVIASNINQANYSNLFSLIEQDKNEIQEYPNTPNYIVNQNNSKELEWTNYIYSVSSWDIKNTKDVEWNLIKVEENDYINFDNIEIDNFNNYDIFYTIFGISCLLIPVCIWLFIKLNNSTYQQIST